MGWTWRTWRLWATSLLTLLSLGCVGKANDPRLRGVQESNEARLAHVATLLGDFGGRERTRADRLPGALGSHLAGEQAKVGKSARNAQELGQLAEEEAGRWERRWPENRAWLGDQLDGDADGALDSAATLAR